MRFDIKNLAKNTKVGKFVTKMALAAALLTTGAVLNETFDQDNVEALEAPKATVVEEAPLAMPIADEQIITLETAKSLFSETKSEEPILSTESKPNVQTVTAPTATKPVSLAVAAPKPAVNTATLIKPSVLPVSAKLEETKAKKEIIEAVKPVATIQPVTPVKKDETVASTVTATSPLTMLSFTTLEGTKVTVPFEGNSDEFSGMFAFRDGKWVALNKKEALKVNPYQNLNWTRNNLILEAIQWEYEGIAKELAWNDYYRFEAKREPQHYELVNGYTRPNKLYFSTLVTSSIAAAKEANAKGDAFTTNEWLRNAQEHLNSYYAAPGKDVTITGLVDGKVPNFSTAPAKITATVQSAPTTALVEEKPKNNADHVDVISENPVTPVATPETIVNEKTETTPVEVPETIVADVTPVDASETPETETTPVEVPETIVVEEPQTEATPVTEPTASVDTVVEKVVESTEDAVEGASEDLVQ